MVQTVSELDCRGKATSETGRALIGHYNACRPGARFRARIDDYPAGLRVWLLEAGARHGAERVEDGWRLTVERGASPAQGSIPGVHHVVARGDSVWACERARRVARLDAENRSVAAMETVAIKASHLALSADGATLFVADSDADAMIALEARSLSEIGRWQAPGGPQLPLASLEGIVCVTGSASGTLTIARPRAGGYATQTIAVGSCPHDPVLTVDGAFAFVPCAGGAELVKVRLSDGRIAGRCAVGNGPSHLALHPDGSRVYSANSWDGTLTCVTVEGERAGDATSGGWAHAIDITPDGRTVWVANFLDDTLAVFDADTLDRLALLPTEAYAHGLDVSPDGRHVVATGFSSDFVRLYDARTHEEAGCVKVGRGSSHSAFTGDAAWIGCSVDDHVACLDLAARRELARIRINA